MTSSSNKLLIYIVAHNAQDKIQKVLDKIPVAVTNKYDYEILIIDDSSIDNTFSIAHKQELNNNGLNIKVLYNPLKQGYGNNLKLGFEYAIQNNFDIIVLLHGGGLYAPEVIYKMVDPIFKNEADTIIGSRVLHKKKNSLKKIPFYKLIGNKVLTTYQNRMLKTKISDFHSGYRAYSVKTLKDIPFKTNSDNFLFDTQIIIQLLLAKKRIAETSIPVYSGREIYFINGIKYGLAGIKASLASKLHKLSIFYRREYDLTDPFDDYSLKLGYLSSHSLAINNTKAGSKVIDIGGGQGRISSELKKKGCFVAGVDRCTLKNKNSYDLFYQKDLDNFIIDFDLKQFDFVLLLDIIEHLSNPEDFLDMLRREFGLSQPKIIITTPNIAFFITRLQLFIGKFNYGKEGILDKTHKRLFTFNTLKRTCSQCGYKVEKVVGIPAPYPKALGLNTIGKLLLSINRLFIFISKSLFSYQIYFEVKPTPVVSALLKNTIEESKKKKEVIQNQTHNYIDNAKRN